MKTITAIIIAATLVGIGLKSAPKDEGATIAPSSPPPPEAKAIPAIPPPAGFPASFTVTYTGPGVPWTATCTFFGTPTMRAYNLSLDRWTDVPGDVMVWSDGGRVSVCFDKTLGQWWAQVGSDVSGNSFGPQFTTRFPMFGTGTITVQ